VCIDRDGDVLPPYAALARIWQEQGRPIMTAEDLEDLDELLDRWEDERRESP
jgi:hypothetical protein